MHGQRIGYSTATAVRPMPCDRFQSPSPQWGGISLLAGLFFRIQSGPLNGSEGRYCLGDSWALMGRLRSGSLVGCDNVLYHTPPSPFSIPLNRQDPPPLHPGGAYLFSYGSLPIRRLPAREPGLN